MVRARAAHRRAIPHPGDAPPARTGDGALPAAIARCQLAAPQGHRDRLEESGGDPALADAAYAAFFVERNRVDFYADARDALARIAGRLPVCALSNGNADLAAIGIERHFAHCITAREFGCGKPDAAIFLHACERLGFAPHEVLHVGDDIEADIAGAHRAGLIFCWLHRDDARERHPAWPRREFVATLTFPTLAALADWLDAQPRDEDAR